MKFLLFGTGVGGNYGCDAIVFGTERILHHRFPDSEVWLPHRSWRTPDYCDILGTDSGITIKSGWRDVRMANLYKSVCRKSGLFAPRHLVVPKTLVKQSDCVLSIGGDLYTFANKEKNWPFPYSIMDAGNEIMRLGKPYVIWCASVGPLEKAGTRLGELIEHLKACRAIIVREQESFSYLQETIGLKDNVYLAADPAFVMEAEPFDCPFLNQQSTDQLVAINFSLGPMQHVSGHMPVEEFQADLVLIVQHLLDKIPLRILFVPHVKKDNEFLYPILAKLRKQYPERVAILPDNIGAKKTKWAVSQANALLTMRFHCSLAGFSTKTPTMILVSTSKGAKICKEMYGDMEYGLNIGDMNAGTVIAKINSLLDNEETIRARLAQRCEEMKKRTLSAGDILAKVL